MDTENPPGGGKRVESDLRTIICDSLQKAVIALNVALSKRSLSYQEVTALAKTIKTLDELIDRC